METKSNDASSRHPPQRADSETQALSAFPEWETWAGAIAGLLYAKRSDPQIVVRSTSIEGLCAEIERAERERGLR